MTIFRFKPEMEMSEQNLWFDVIDVSISHTGLAQIVLKQNSTTPDGKLAVSPQMTSAEIDQAIDALKNELDRCAVKAKAIAQ